MTDEELGLETACALGGFTIEANPVMAGMKKAVKMGSRVVVSPAVLSLMRSEKGPKLVALLRSLGVIEITPPGPPGIGMLMGFLDSPDAAPAPDAPP